LPAASDPSKEIRLQCLDLCKSNLSKFEQQIIGSYYVREGQSKSDHRKNLAAKLSLEMNVLRIQACRIRKKLGRCISDCVKKREESSLESY